MTGIILLGAGLILAIFGTYRDGLKDKQNKKQHNEKTSV